MPKKAFTPEQIVPKLRQIEVLIAQGKTVPLAWRVRKRGLPLKPSTGGGKNTEACNWNRPRS